MELAEPNIAAAVVDVAPAVFTVSGIVLDTNQFIAATHAAISLVVGLGQIGAIFVGIWAMVSTSRRRTDEYDKRHQQIMDDQKRRHEDTMAAHRASEAAQDRRHRQIMDDQKQRHEEVMATQDQHHRQIMDDQKQRHEEAMKALEELIRRTAPPANEA